MLRLRIKEAATAKGWTAMKLSHRSEVSYSLLRKLFRDPYHTITTSTLDRLATALEMPIAALVEDVSEQEAAAERARLDQSASE